jgi:hypothetical protein
VRVVQAGRDLDLAQKAVGAQVGREVLAQHLDRDLAVMAQSAARYTVAIPPAPSSRSMR